jgi:RNA polymerase sigma-70 factor (ECF subfamily)
VSATRSDDAQVTAWALAAGAGDRKALERFVRATQRDVWRFVAHLAEVSLADDLAQEVYLRAIRGLPQFHGRSTARTWLLSIARRVVVDHVRAAVARPRTTSTVDWADAADKQRSGVGFEEIVELNLLLAGLDPDRREALFLTQVLGLSYAEVAEICGCPVGTIRSRVARARTDLMTAHEQRDAGAL